jgi:hypothetical protein
MGSIQVHRQFARANHCIQTFFFASFQPSVGFPDYVQSTVLTYGTNLIGVVFFKLEVRNNVMNGIKRVNSSVKVK